MNARLIPTQFLPRKESSGLNASAAPRYVHFGRFDLDLQRQELLRDGSRVKLRGKAYEVLRILIEKPGEVVTREELRARLWPLDKHVNYDANVNTTVNKLRQVLGDSPDQPDFVETIPRMGYTFIAKVEYLDQPAASSPRPKARHEPGSFAEAIPVSAGWFLESARRSPWFTAGIIALLIAGMLFVAALVLFAHRA